MSARTILVILTAALVGAACSKRPLEQLPEARRVSEDMLVQFTKAADAANRAVMADTDEASTRFAREAEQMSDTVANDAGALKPLLQALAYPEEVRLLEEFDRRFAEYRALDRTILELAVQNTNLKAQRLSFGPAQEAVDTFRAALDDVVPANRANDEWRVKALIATAVASLREIQVLQAPHIAEADDAAMTELEQRMTTAEARVRAALRELTGVISHASLPRVAAGRASIDAFMKLNTTIVGLSRRNTNVRSLALTLNQKGQLTTACEESLRRLRDALAKRTLGGTR